MRVLILAAAYLLSAAPSGAQLLFEDDFDNGLVPSWVDPWGGWSLTEGHLFNENVCGFMECSNPIYNGTADWVDYVVECEFTPTYGSTSHGNVLFVIICAAEPTRFFNTPAYDVDIGWNNEIKINRSTGNGSAERIAYDAGPEYHLATGATYVVKFGKIGSSLMAKVFEKGSPEPGWQITATDSVPRAGYFGFHTWNTRGWIDNVRAYGSPVPVAPVTWGQMKATQRALY